MDLVEFKCDDEGCYEVAEVKCTCKIEIKFCFPHYRDHGLLNRCKFKYIDEKVLLKKIMLVENAFYSLKSKLITLSLTEVGKINTSLRRNYNLNIFNKFQIRYSSDSTESPNFIIMLDREYSIIDRGKKCFISNVEYMLCINGKSEEIKDKLTKVDNEVNKEISQLTRDIEQLKNKLESFSLISFKFSAEIKNEEKIGHSRKYIEAMKQDPYANIVCNLELAKFEEKDLSRKIEYLIRQGYQWAEEWFVKQSKFYKALKVSMTKCTKYIFICKF